MTQSFETFNIYPSIITALEKEKITTPTMVQEIAIPKIMENKDLIVKSQTGSGKTLAYLLPLFQKIDSLSKDLQAVVLVPTHELAIQVIRQTEMLSNNSDVKIKSALIIGNVNISRQLEKLKEKPHIIVGSPGRILELIKMRKIKAHAIKTIILDEADRLMDKNNVDNILAIIKTTLKERQILMFSATMSEKSVQTLKEVMKEPEVVICQQSMQVPTTIEHIYFLTEQRDKVEVLRKLIRILNPKKAIAFMNNGKEIDIFTSKLQYHGIKVDSLYGTNTKVDRKRAMDGFKTGKIQLLVASDIAARGLDIEGITHIFNIDMPENPENYLHRVGRTGRKGNAGVAVSIVSQEELPLVKTYQNSLNISIKQRKMYKGKII